MSPMTLIKKANRNKPPAARHVTKLRKSGLFSRPFPVQTKMREAPDATSQLSRGHSFENIDVAANRGEIYSPPSGDPVARPIQRTLSLEKGKAQHEVRQQNLADLKRLLRGSGARIRVRKGGRIEFTRRPKSQQGSQHPGYRLIQSLIDHRHNVRLGYRTGEDDAKTFADDPEAATKKKQGSGGRIALSKDAAARSVVNRAGALGTEDTPRYMMLGHELIHASRSARGRRKTEGRVEYPVSGTIDGRQLNANYGSRREEAETVGLIAHGDRRGITENDIRAAHGLPPRAAYESDVDNFLSWARRTTQPRTTRTLEDLLDRKKLSSKDTLAWL